MNRFLIFFGIVYMLSGLKPLRIKFSLLHIENRQKH